MRKYTVGKEGAGIRSWRMLFSGEVEDLTVQFLGVCELDSSGYFVTWHHGQ